VSDWSTATVSGMAIFVRERLALAANVARALAAVFPPTGSNALVTTTVLAIAPAATRPDRDG
jgi:hypothetical protein